MKRFINFILSILVRVVFYLATILPEKIFTSIITSLTSLYFRFARRYRRKINENLNLAYGSSIADQEIERTTDSIAQNIGLSLAETIITTTSKQNSILERITSKGKGVIAVSAHLGNFTILAITMLKKGYPFNILIREPDYSAIVKIFRKLKKRQGAHFIHVNQWRDALRQMLTCLRKNEIVCLMSDERKKGSDVIVDFFGQPALTATGPATLALKTGAPIVPIFIVRTGKQSHTIFIEPQMDVAREGDPTQSIVAVTATYTKIIEDYVRAYPEQWFWFKNRWAKE